MVTSKNCSMIPIRTTNTTDWLWYGWLTTRWRTCWPIAKRTASRYPNSRAPSQTPMLGNHRLMMRSSLSNAKTMRSLTNPMLRMRLTPMLSLTTRSRSRLACSHRSMLSIARPRVDALAVMHRSTTAEDREGDEDRANGAIHYYNWSPGQSRRSNGAPGLERSSQPMAQKPQRDCLHIKLKTELRRRHGSCLV